MKVGITADLHLSADDKHPERENGLLDILRQCSEQNIEQLIIAGDLFDSTFSSYSRFESICKRSAFSGIQILIIPGNHDPSISNKQIVGKNIRIFDQPLHEKLADDLEACFIPYREAQTMGKAISELIGTDNSRRWALIGHGDWFDNLDKPNPYEGPKVYMPLTRREVELYKPHFVFLGHIHVPQKMGNVYYAGSPCPVAVNETGYRRFLTLDTETSQVDEIRVNSDVLYFHARLIVMPTKDEHGPLLRQIEEYKQSWNIRSDDLKKVKVQVEAVGFSNDRKAGAKTLRRGFSEFELIDDLDISQVNRANDEERNFIIDMFRDELSKVDYPIGEGEQPTEEEILLRAMELVYGRK